MSAFHTILKCAIFSIIQVLQQMCIIDHLQWRIRGAQGAHAPLPPLKECYKIELL